MTERNPLLKFEKVLQKEIRHDMYATNPLFEGITMNTPNPMEDVEAWWENLIDLHPPKNAVVADTMDEVRDKFKELGLDLIENLPSGANLTVALRALKDACQHSIAAIACDQDYYDD